ncbi:hypothetical protein C8F01DRAFT_987303 [Mycena amicta]|nr:hypothetical protein C8F01DRAFT_987303 [Mycena amicta]
MSVFVRGLKTAATKRAARTPNLQPRISTLDPARLQRADYLDLSSHPKLLVDYLPRSSGSREPASRVQFHPLGKTPFPPQTSGFLYFHKPDEAPVRSLAGGIRFRRLLGPTADFATGTDLLHPDGSGEPWEIPLTTLVRSQPSLGKLLVQDDLVTELQMERCQRLFGTKKPGAEPQLLHWLEQPFVVNFGARTLRMDLVSLHNKYEFSLSGPFSEQKGTRPYKGASK